MCDWGFDYLEYVWCLICKYLVGVSIIVYNVIIICNIMMYCIDICICSVMYFVYNIDYVLILCIFYESCCGILLEMYGVDGKRKEV